jgi:hypothetical protein
MSHAPAHRERVVFTVQLTRRRRGMGVVLLAVVGETVDWPSWD